MKNTLTFSLLAGSIGLLIVSTVGQLASSAQDNPLRVPSLPAPPATQYSIGQTAPGGEHHGVIRSNQFVPPVTRTPATGSSPNQIYSNPTTSRRSIGRVFPNTPHTTHRQAGLPSPVQGLQSGPCGCQITCAQMTVMVPCWETRYFNQNVTRYRPELRQKVYRTKHIVYDDVPKTEAYTVMIPDQRKRTYTVNIQAQRQVPVQENYTVMVPKPAQREVPFERTEEFKVPVEVPYQVMVPVKKEIQNTKYKTVIDKEPYQKRYLVEVPKERIRMVTTYEKVPLVKVVRRFCTLSPSVLLQPRHIRYRSLPSNGFSLPKRTRLRDEIAFLQPFW